MFNIIKMAGQFRPAINKRQLIISYYSSFVCSRMWLHLLNSNSWTHQTFESVLSRFLMKHLCACSRMRFRNNPCTFHLYNLHNNLLHFPVMYRFRNFCSNQSSCKFHHNICIWYRQMLSGCKELSRGNTESLRPIRPRKDLTFSF